MVDVTGADAHNSSEPFKIHLNSDLLRDSAQLLTVVLDVNLIADVKGRYQREEDIFKALVTVGCIFFVVFCNISVTGFPVKFGLLSPGRARQRRCRAYSGHWGNRTLLIVEEIGVPGGNHRYVTRAENPFYMVQHV
jgi:hypothetical protein